MCPSEPKMSAIIHQLRNRVYTGVKRNREYEEPTGGQLYKRPRLRVSPSVASRLMVRTRFSRKRKARTFRRRKNYRRRASQPGKIVRVFKTVKYIALNPGAAGAIDARTMVPNSVFDPTGGEGIEQPLGFDETANQYNKYSVVRARYYFEATSADATNPVMLGARASADSATLTSYQHYKELPGTVSRIMTPEQDKVTFGLTIGIAKIFGNKLTLTDDRYTADVGANCTNSVYAHVFAQPVDGTTDVGVIHLVCTLYQTVVFFKPKTLARS